MTSMSPYLPKHGSRAPKLRAVTECPPDLSGTRTNNTQVAPIPSLVFGTWDGALQLRRSFFSALPLTTFALTNTFWIPNSLPTFSAHDKLRDAVRPDVRLLPRRDFRRDSDADTLDCVDLGVHE